MKKMSNLQADSILPILNLFKEHMMFLLTTQEKLIASTSMVQRKEQFQTLVHSVGIFKHAMIYQFNSVTNQQLVVSDGKHMMNMDGLQIVKNDSISPHSTTGHLTFLVEEIQEQILKVHQILFSRTVTLIHGVVEVS